MSVVSKKEGERGIIAEIGAAIPLAEQGRQPNRGRIEVAQAKRHCQSGKYAFEKAKLGKFFVQLNLGKTLGKINKAQKQNNLEQNGGYLYNYFLIRGFLGVDFAVLNSPVFRFSGLAV